MKFFIVIFVLTLVGSLSAIESTQFNSDSKGKFSTTLRPPQSGNYQVWLTYRSQAEETFDLSFESDTTTLNQPGQPTPEKEQHFRQYLGIISLKVDTEAHFIIDGEAPGFQPDRIELLPVPTLAPELEPLFHTSLQFFDQLVRTPNGLYRDAYRIGSPPRNEQDRQPDHLPRPESTCSIASIGVGLMALCIEHELGLNDNTADKALQTLRLINGKAPDIQLDRDATGFFRHFVSIRSGSGRSEFSTIDTAILTVGALYCRNTFDNPEIRKEADALWHSIVWPVALDQPDGERLYMALENGQPNQKSRTHLFSEYYLLAWLIQQYEVQQTGSSHVDLSLKHRWPYRKMSLLTDGRPRAHCSFQVQFPFYMCHPVTTDPLYFSFVGNQARSDHFTSAERNGNDAWWGCGAGGTPEDGYFAADFLNNPDRVVSPRIIAGFMPAYPVAQQQLLRLYGDPEKRLATPVGDLLPRFSVNQPDWRHHRIEAIDFSSMMFGLAALHPDLGMEFFEEKTRFTFGPAPSEE